MVPSKGLTIPKYTSYILLIYWYEYLSRKARSYGRSIGSGSYRFNGERHCDKGSTFLGSRAWLFFRSGMRG